LTHDIRLTILHTVKNSRNVIYPYKTQTDDATEMLGCFNPTLGQIWTNSAIGLNFYITFFNPTFGFDHI